MDTPLAGERLTEEKAFIKRYTEGLSSHKVEYTADYSSPLSERPRKVPIVQVPIAAPPDVMDVDAPAVTDTPITLTVKSLKPSLSFTVAASLTDTVADLKSLVAKSSSTAPAVDAQRLLLKGKALSDTKLLKEYDLVDGATVHLILKPSTPAITTTDVPMSAPAPAPMPVPSTSAPSGLGHRSTPSTSSITPPSLTISTHMDDDEGGRSSPQPLPLSDMVNTPLGPQAQVSSAAFHNTISDPVFWQKIHALCVSEFEYEGDADAAWELFLRSVKQRLSAGEAAKIRDVVGVSSMGGGA